VKLSADDDGHAALTYLVAIRLTEQSYLGGATFTW
jgi:hypothetical protein